MENKPNILLILTDQQHYGMMSCAGNRYLHTPAMDSLASSGVRFDRAYCTNPVCVPSRFSLMTGRMPSAIEMRSNKRSHIEEIPSNIKNNGLGYLMREAGYEVAYAGKQHLPKMTVEDIGFECISHDERDEMAQACAQFFRRPRNKPFFLVSSFVNPHDICYMGIRDFAQEGGDKHLLEGASVECATLDKALQRPEGVDETTFFERYCPPLPVNFEPQKDEPEAIGRMLEERYFRKQEREQWDEKRWREHRWAYARLTEMVDQQISQVLSALEKSGEAERTLVVFTSDHGDMDGAHRLEHKSTMYDEACRVPLIIRPPGGGQGKEICTDLVTNGLDLLPTFFDWAGVNSPPGLTGMSLRPLVEGDRREGARECIPIELPTGRGVVTERYKYTLHDAGANREQLIDLKADPYEQANVCTQPEYQSVLRELKTLYKKTFGA